MEEGRAYCTYNRASSLQSADCVSPSLGGGVAPGMAGKERRKEGRKEGRRRRKRKRCSADFSCWRERDRASGEHLCNCVALACMPAGQPGRAPAPGWPTGERARYVEK